MAVPVVFTDTSSELFPRQKSCSNATSCHERPQSIVFRCGREKESTRRCIEWYTIRRSELHVTPIPCPNKRRKTTENAGEPNAMITKPQGITIYSGRIRLATELHAQPAAQLVESRAAQTSTVTITKDFLLWIVKNIIERLKMRNTQKTCLYRARLCDT